MKTMKKLLIVLLVTIISVTTFAQHRYYSPRPYTRSHVSVSIGRPVYPYYRYDPFYYPYNTFGYYYSPRISKLDLEIQDIRADYEDKIWSAKHDENLSKAERKKTVHRLKYERDQAINRAQRNYYRSY